MIIPGKIPEVPFLSRDYWELGQVHLGQDMPDSPDFPCRRESRARCGEKTTSSEFKNKPAVCSEEERREFIRQVLESTTPRLLTHQIIGFLSRQSKLRRAARVCPVASGGGGALGLSSDIRGHGFGILHLREGIVFVQ